MIKYVGCPPKTVKVILEPRRLLIFVTILLAILIMPSLCNAATHYIDAINGNDVNSGLSQSTPWKSIAKVNTSTFNPGDDILLKRGDVWREQLTIPTSGSSGHLVTFGAYGTGASPIITGFNILTGFSALSSSAVYQLNGLTTQCGGRRKVETAGGKKL